MRVVAFVGFKGSGKNTAARPLLDDGWVGISYGDAVKDALAAIFQWPRHLLEGDTDESRRFREEVDPWWAQRLCIADFSPRIAMQRVATEAMRVNFHRDIWVASVARRVAMLPADSRVVILDARFGNEVAYARDLGATVVRIKRGLDPAWMSTAAYANAGNISARNKMLQHWRIHESEWAWIGVKLDRVIVNDATPSDLHARVRALVATIPAAANALLDA